MLLPLRHIFASFFIATIFHRIKWSYKIRFTNYWNGEKTHLQLRVITTRRFTHLNRSETFSAKANCFLITPRKKDGQIKKGAHKRIIMWMFWNYHLKWFSIRKPKWKSILIAIYSFIEKPLCTFAVSNLTTNSLLVSVL